MQHWNNYQNSNQQYNIYQQQSYQQQGPPTNCNYIPYNYQQQQQQQQQDYHNNFQSHYNHQNQHSHHQNYQQHLQHHHQNQQQRFSGPRHAPYRNQKSSYYHNKNFQRHTKSKPSQNDASGLSSFRCEPCEKDFTSQTAYEAHQKTHVKCEVAGCPYIASSKAVKLHYIQTHEEGRFRICLTTPEEIKKWREERKRNWPSKLNIELKKKKLEEEKQLGINVSTKEFTYQGDSKSNKRGRGIKEKHRRDGKKNNINNNISRDSQQTNESGVNKEKTEENKTNMDGIQNNTKVTSSMGSSAMTGLGLLSGYDDDVEEEISVKTENKALKMIEDEAEIVDENNNTTKNSNDIQIEDGEIMDEEEKQADQQPSLPKRLQNQDFATKKPRNRKQLSKGSENKVHTKKPVSLLEMLLANEIRHERNVILQCVRFIVKQDFFRDNNNIGV